MSDTHDNNEDKASESNDKSKLKIKKKTDSYMKYSSWGYTLFGLMLIAILIGQYVDDHFELEKPYTTLFLLAVVIISKFYTLIKDLA